MKVVDAPEMFGNDTGGMVRFDTVHHFRTRGVLATSSA